MDSVNSAVSSTQSIEDIEQRLAGLREQLSEHPLYAAIRTIGQLRIFMESHVFAVWDFMCLLKSLQRALTSVDAFWVPTKFPASRRFINEIVLGEESDEYEGRPMSHFEMYLEAMQRVGADTAAITSLIDAIRPGAGDRKAALEEALLKAPLPAQQFVRSTLRMIQQHSLPAQAAAFTFGREDAIPDMFRSLVRDMNQKMGGDLTQFVWYLERHIEVDGEDHGPLSLRMVADLCGSDPELWSDAAQAAEDALRSRLLLWDGVLEQVQRAEG
ncbi:MAG TPA: DUF3050 domain-containing protein [Edaphobacter sp.]